MNGVELLLDIVTLIIRETQINIDTNSDVIINEILDMYHKDAKKWRKGNSDTIVKISSLIKSLLETRTNGDEIDINSLSRSLGIILLNDEDMADSESGDIVRDIISSITSKKSSEDIESEIKRLKRIITNIYTKEKIRRVISSKSLELNKNDVEHKAIFEYLESTVSELESIRAKSNIADEAIMAEVDLSATDLLDTINETIIEKHIFKTGFIGLNRMLQGGIRTSEFTTVSALSHNYKTGLTLSIFASVLLLNKPRPPKDKKKPLAIWLSFEDDIINIIEHIYRLIYITESNKNPDLTTTKLSDMIKVIQTRLQATGFNVKILRVNPAEWSYKDIFNKVNSYNAKGFEVQILAVDYLDKLPTTGLSTNGPLGSEKKELVKKVRNFMSGLDIAFITPWQLSSGANNLRKDGLADKDFLKYIWDKSYYQGSSTLNTEIDLEIFANKVKVQNGFYALNIHRGKHKLSSTLTDEKDMNIYIPFPKQGPIPLDVMRGEESSVYDMNELEAKMLQNIH